MLDLIEMKEGTQYTPLMIGVCGEEGVTLCADSRSVFFDGECFVADDRCRKIFRPNEHLLYGACGVFGENDTLVEPLAGRNVAELNVDMATDIVADYLIGEIGAGRTLYERSYVLGGLDADGLPCLSIISYNSKTGTVSTDITRTDGKSAYVLMLPPSAMANKAGWRAMFEELLADGSRVLPERMNVFIRELTHISELVGGELRGFGVKA